MDARLDALVGGRPLSEGDDLLVAAPDRVLGLQLDGVLVVLVLLVVVVIVVVVLRAALLLGLGRVDRARGRDRLGELLLHVVVDLPGTCRGGRDLLGVDGLELGIVTGQALEEPPEQGH